MKNPQLTILLITLLFLQFFASLAFIPDTSAQTDPDVYVGVDISYGDVAEAKALIDQVGGFTNLIVVGTTKITWYPNKLTEAFQYAYERGLSFIGLTPALSHIGFDSTPSASEWFQYAEQNWGDRLLGFYYLDEPGGRQLDRAQGWVWDNSTISVGSYAEAANQFTSNLGNGIEWTKTSILNSSKYPLCTSDYALYWFDYKAGYDTVFAEFGWNYSRQLNVALCRGAAQMQNKDWGVIVTWTYTEPPYIESGEELYNDLVLAYDSGAKYIIVFDGNEGWTQGILEQEHLEALQRFWAYVHNNPRKSNPVSGRSAYVLPNAYGYGFRGPQDHIWGLWEADALAYNMSINVKSLLNEYGEKLDIIYDDGLQLGNNYGYHQLIYWDSYCPPPPEIVIQSPENRTYTSGNVSLTFSVDKPVTWMGFSLDGQAQTTLTENTTLYNLPDGPHNVTVYAKDEFENMGVSETIHFNIAQPAGEPFPVTLMIGSIASAVAAISLGSLAYFKKSKAERREVYHETLTWKTAPAKILLLSYLFLNTNAPFFSSTTITMFLSTFSSKIIFDNSFNKFFWITRFIGLAPN